MESSFLNPSSAKASPLGGVVEGLDAAAQPLSGGANPSGAVLPQVVPGEILVQFRPGAGIGIRREARDLLGGTRLETIHTPLMQRVGMGVLERLTLPQGKGTDPQAAIEAINNNPNVVYAEPNYIYQPAAISNDPYYTNGSLWGMYGDDSPSASGPTGTTNAFGSQAEKAWRDNITGSSNVVVGIIDEGIQTTHPDLANNIWVNPWETVDGKDNDGNGYIDDINGWDFVNNDNTVYDAGGDSHGTHVAGTIGGDGNNGIGVAGVNWDVSMISAKFLGTNGGSTSDAIKALDYLTDLKTRHGINLVASNNSWGGGGYSQALHDAIIRSAKQDILFIAAAGNSTSNNDTTASYPSNYNTTVGTTTQSPAAYDGVIAVASITSTGGISSFSSYGATTVDLGAPGSGINSTVPSNTYASYNGTSMATPHVTGAAALYASLFPSGVSAAEIRSALLSSATPTSALAGKTVTGGRLNVQAALAQANSLTTDQTVYSLPETVTLSLRHRAANQNSATLETVNVSIASTTEPVAQTVQLTETGVNTGLFSGAIQLDDAAPAVDGTLQAAHGDLITVSYAPLALTTTATVDTFSPLISAISELPKSSSSQILWTTDEPASTEVVYGTSATALNSTVTVPGLVKDHAAALNGLNPETTYYYQLRSLDAAGNITESAIRSFTTSTRPPILFVDDDQGAAYERFYASALQANNYAYESWDVTARGASPSAQDLAPYKAVIWNTGYDYTSAITTAEETSITGYLNGGGRLYLSGQDVLYSGVSASFRSNFLKVNTFTNDVTSSAHTESGVSGNAVSNGQSLSVTVPSDFPLLYVDAVTPVTGAQGAFQHGVSTASSPFSAISYRGDYNAGGFGMVFTTFPFEAVSTSAADPNNQKTLLKRILDFLHLPQGSVNVSSASSPATSEVGGAVSFSVTLDRQPTQNVTVPLSCSDPSEATLGSLTSLIFTPQNWSTPQSVTVTGVNDAVDDGDVTYAVVLGSVSSADPAFSALDPSDVSLLNTDDDTAGITVSAPSGTSTSEAGGQVSFSVVLNSEPTAPVTIPLSSSNTAEGSISPASLSFTAANWNQAQTVTVSGVDDAVYDGTKSYTVVIGAASSTDSLYNGRNPADIALTNLDDDPVPPTKFFVVNDGSPDRTFEYAADGFSVEDYALTSGNTAPRGIATNADGSRTWVIDANRRVYVYDAAGQSLGNWLALGLPSTVTLEGIATDGNDIWILDARTDRLYYYAGAASRTSGDQTAPTNGLALATGVGNSNPKDIVYGANGSGGKFLWVVNDASVDRVYRYSLSATSNNSITLANYWPLSSSNKAPTGIAINPATSALNDGSLWVMDNGSTKRVFHYSTGRTITTTNTGSTAPANSVAFTLPATNTNPQGLADPTPLGVLPSLPGLPELPKTGESAALIRQAIRRGMREVIRTVGPLTGNSPSRVEAWLDEVESLVLGSYPTAPIRIVRSVLREALAAQRRLLRRLDRV